MKRDTDNGFIEVGFKPENVTSKPSAIKPANGDRDIDGGSAGATCGKRVV